MCVYVLYCYHELVIKDLYILADTATYLVTIYDKLITDFHKKIDKNQQVHQNEFLHSLAASTNAQKATSFASSCTAVRTNTVTRWIGNGFTLFLQPVLLV